MKSFLYIPFLLSTAFGSYLSGLDRTFDEVELKIVDLYVTMPTSQVNSLINMAQISLNDVQTKGAGNIPDFEYNNATIVANWNGNSKTYEQVKFKTGGMYGRSNDKVGFNLKFDKKFLNRKNFKLRPDPGDSSRLRSKICCDILNRLGVPSVQGTYARLYMNNQYWGLYTLMDSIKTSWIKQTFNPSEKEVTTLIQCKSGGFHLKPNSSYACINANDDYPDMSKFSTFISNVNNAKTVSDIEKYMDVDIFLKHIAFEWLIGSFDHFMIYGHNFNWYRRESDGKWIIIYYDFDNTFGNGISSSLWSSKTSNQDGTAFNRNKSYVDFTLADWEKNIPILKKLIFNNKTKFKQIVRDVLVQAFNPDILNPHIDEIKTFLNQYVKEDCTKGSDGKYPGRINKKGTQKTPSFSSFENNIENSLKTWIKNKFNVAISNYSLNKSDILAESAKFVPKPYDYGNGSSTTTTKTKTKTTTTTTTTKKTTTTTKASSETSSSAEPEGTRYDIIKSGSSKIDSEWINWSWGVESYKFDNDSNMVSYTNSGAWGGVCFKRGDNVLLESGTLFFKAKTNDTNSIISVIFHQVDSDDYVNAGVIENPSTTEMTQYSVTLKGIPDGKYDRITLQDGKNYGLTIYLNDVYFVADSISTITTTTTTSIVNIITSTTVKTTTTTTVKTTTTTTPSSSATNISGDRYDIIKSGSVNSQWMNWSWGVQSKSFDTSGNMVNVLNFGSWGAVSFKRSDKVQFGDGVLYFKAKANIANASLKILVHLDAVDEYVKVGTVYNISNTGMTQYSVTIKEPAKGKYSRISIQDGNNKGLTLYLNDVYFVSGATAATITTTTTIPPPVTTTTSVTAAYTNVDGKRYDIIVGGSFKVSSQWDNWSWGIESNRFNSQGYMVNYIKANAWGAVSFKRNDKLKFGSGTLYFKSKTPNANSNIQILLHLADVDSYVNVGTIQNLATDRMTQYSVKIKELSQGKFDRISFQDAKNTGLKFYLNEVYFVADN